MRTGTKNVPSHPLWRKALGRPGDWMIRIPNPRVPQPGVRWIGPLLVAASVAVSWPAFSGAVGEGGRSVSSGLYLGAVSIVLMAWSFVLALRILILELPPFSWRVWLCGLGCF